MFVWRWDNALPETPFEGTTRQLTPNSHPGRGTHNRSMCRAAATGFADRHRAQSRRYARIATIRLQIVRHRLSSQRADGQSRPVIGDALLLQYVLRKCSMRSVTELTVRQARQMLTAWAAEQDAVGSRRDEVVRAAIDAGLSKSEVHRLTGIARTTIDRILGTLPPMEQDPR